MRFIFLVLMGFMLLFMAVQYNDPDGWVWMLFYGVPAFWCALVFFKLDVFSISWVRVGLLSCIAASVIGIFYYWPLMPKFWTQQVWYNSETAREGLGMMIIAAVLVSVLVFENRQRQR